VDDIPAAEGIVKDLFFFHMLEQGFYLARRGFIVLSLPLTDADLERFHAAVESFLTRFGEGLPR
jgi:glutamate-1-semialdehyde 2,1-aminomutase